MRFAAVTTAAARAASIGSALAVVVLTGCAADPPSAVVGVVASGCGARSVGSGAFVDDDLVLTSAHTLRGADSVTVDVAGRSLDAVIVAFDPDLDLAYLRVEATGASPSPLTVSDGDPASRATAWAVRDGQPVRLDVEVVRRIRLETEDVYVEGETVRPAYELRAVVEPGDSGGPVVADGDLIGVLWARSTQTPGLAYAIDAARGSTTIDEQVATGDLSAVDLDRCD